MITFIQLGNYGRLGNSLFQLSTTISHSIKYNTYSVFPNWEYQNDFPDLGKNCLFLPKDQINFQNNYSESSFLYSEIPNIPDLNLSGYFQSYKYINEDKIRQCLLFPKHQYLSDTIAIHIRHGDYLRYPLYHPIQPISYYRDAIDILGKDNKYIIFSDDISWCKENFKDIEINETLSTIDDFKKMSSCRSFIIANSSFSWWAAYLANDNNKKVIAPNLWFGEKLKNTHPISDLILPNWILI
jgi:hypothetical protein